ncbi:hypothetical protein [Maliponia aquimaris]|uniref:hypothetical protein n=1 Tax=Maliponia aquimaris TaxID=1673631 RepID=UPI0011403B03|nr:hypothetical protein [Maliponia aquimaris]
MEPTEHEFQLFKLLNGGSLRSKHLHVANIPLSVADFLGWTARKVFISSADAQKIRHHPMHGMNAEKGLALPLVIKFGDYYQSRKRGSDLQIEIVLHEPEPKRAYFLVLARNIEDTGLFIRTFYYNSKLSRSKMKGARSLLAQSPHRYFKE